jgi:hypothetical protein
VRGRERKKEFSVCYIYDHVKLIFGDDLCRAGLASLSGGVRAFVLHGPFAFLPYDVDVRRGSSGVVPPFQ